MAEKTPCLVYLTPGQPSLGLFILVLQKAPEMTIAFEISESQARDSKHTQPFLETVNGPAGLEAEALSARLLGRPTCHGFGRSTCAAEVGHAALHSDQACT